MSRFVVGPLLGQGAFADVFEAIDTHTGAAVALKRLRPAMAAKSALVALFEREPVALAAIDHPAVVRLVHSGRDDEGYFTAIELLGGTTLAERLAREGPMSPTALQPIVATLRAALAAVEAAGWVHRDIKPANVMLDARRGPVLFDFGYAWKIDDPTRHRAVGAHEAALGSPPYMSAEQFDRNALAIGPQTDLYALGVLIFEALTGDLPFGNGRTDTIVARQAAGDLAPFLPRYPVDDAMRAELAALLRVRGLR